MNRRRFIALSAGASVAAGFSDLLVQQHVPIPIIDTHSSVRYNPFTRCDWPNSDQWLPFEEGLNLVRRYFMEKGQSAAEKDFWENYVTAYHWKKRDATQP